MNILSMIGDLENSAQRAALCIVVHVSGSTPRKPGAKMIVIDNHEPQGNIVGSIGGGAIEHHIREQAIEVINANKPRLVQTSLRNELGMCCGGEMTVFIEPIARKAKLFCFGAGHIAQALCPLAAKVGFLVSVTDERKDLLNAPAFSTAQRFDDMSRYVKRELIFCDDTYVVIATHDHDLDQQTVENVLDAPFKYAALVGSQRKALMTKKRLLAKGFAIDQINRIVCPAGLNIFAQTPEEIAVSIIAQMILVRNDSSTDRPSARRGG